MKLTIVTCTHNRKYLNEVLESLLRQTDPDWSWLIVVNGKALETSEPFPIDNRIRFRPSKLKEVSVGAFKREAFDMVDEGIIVELDHDDLLTSNAVEEIKKAFEDSEIGFVYSDCAEFKDETWEPVTFNSAYGWTRRTERIDDKILITMEAFEPSPHSLGYIWWSPNHVRAWRKEVYDKAGKHDPTFRIIDDHDLICRTYLITKFKRIPKCLYLYRHYEGQTYRVYNKEIQEKTQEVYNKYFYQLSKRWCDLNGYRKIDLGAAHGKPEGYEGVDLVNADITADLNKKWPFEDSSVGMIRANDIFEHLPNKIHTMNEAYRVLVDGGLLLVMVPSTEGRGAFQDPTHNTFWNINSFWYYTNPFYAKYVPEIKCKFQVVKLLNYYPSKWHEQNKILYTMAHLSAYKGKRFAGLLEWKKEE